MSNSTLCIFSDKCPRGNRKQQSGSDNVWYGLLWVHIRVAALKEHSRSQRQETEINIRKTIKQQQWPLDSPWMIESSESKPPVNSQLSENEWNFFAKKM